jgi:hypothetical protein
VALPSSRTLARLFMRVRGIFALEQKLREPFVTSVIERRHGSLSSTIRMIQNAVRSKVMMIFSLLQAQRGVFFQSSVLVIRISPVAGR